MAKVGFLIGPKTKNWNSYVKWFKDELNTTLKNPALVHPHPQYGANGKHKDIDDAAKSLAGDSTINVIVTAGTAAALACKQATQANGKPFVFASVGDAKTSGLLPYSGGNYSGGCNGQVTYVDKRVTYMLKNPAFKAPFGVVGNYDKSDPTNPAPKAMEAAVAAIDKALGKGSAQLVPWTEGVSKVDVFIQTLSSQGVNSLYFCSDLWITANSEDLNKEAAKAGIATMWEIEEQKANGATDAHGVSFQDMFETAAQYVDQILNLKVKSAGDLSLYQPMLALRSKGAASPKNPSRTSAAKKRTAKKRHTPAKKKRPAPAKTHPAKKKRPGKKKSRRSR